LKAAKSVAANYNDSYAFKTNKKTKHQGTWQECGGHTKLQNMLSRTISANYTIARNLNVIPPPTRDDGLAAE